MDLHAQANTRFVLDCEQLVKPVPLENVTTVKDLEEKLVLNKVVLIEMEEI